MKLRNIIIFSIIISTILLLIVIYFYLREQEKKKKDAASNLTAVRIQSEEINLDSSKNLIMVALFFSAWGGDYLLPEKRNIFYTASVTDQAKQAIIELINGPKRKYLLATIPSGTTLRELYLEPEGTVYIDLSREFIETHWGGSQGEIITIYSIINTLTINFPSIQQVKILIEGKEVDSLTGHINLHQAFRLDFSLIGHRSSPNQSIEIIEE